MSMGAVGTVLADSLEFVAYCEALVLWVAGDSLDEAVLQRTGAALCGRAKALETLPEHLLIALRAASARPTEPESVHRLTWQREDRARRYRIALDRLLTCYFG